MKFAATFAGLLLLSITDAHATAIANVRSNEFQLRPSYGSANGQTVGSPAATMAGILITVASQTISTTETETGHAQVNFNHAAGQNPAGIFRASVGGLAVAEPDGYAFGTYTLQLTLAFTNSTQTDFDFLNFHTVFSAFAPPTNGPGAAVHNSETEFARFFTSQTGSGFGDQHACDTRVPGFGTFTGPPAVTCGVPGADHSEVFLVLSDFDVNETLFRSFVLTVVLEVSSVPEPATFAILGVGILGLLRVRSKRMV